MDCAVLDFITKILCDICGTSSNRAVSSSLSVCCLFWWQMRFWFTFFAMGGWGDLSGWSTTNYHNGEYFSHNVNKSDWQVFLLKMQLLLWLEVST